MSRKNVFLTCSLAMLVIVIVALTTSDVATARGSKGSKSQTGNNTNSGMNKPVSTTAPISKSTKIRNGSPRQIDGEQVEKDHR
jgi:hypothetical protein